MPNSLVIIFLSIFCLCLFSCSEPHILITSKYKIQKRDKLYALDSFRVVKIIDNRPQKDSVIGDADYDGNPLTVDKPFPNFLKSTFNEFICKDTSKKYQKPVTVTVNEFFSKRTYSFFYQCAHYNYSFLFQYPTKNGVKSLLIEDSIIQCDDPSIKDQNWRIIQSIRDASYYFISYIANHPDTLEKIQSTQQTKDSTTLNSSAANTKVDTLLQKPYYIYEYKSGATFNYFKSSVHPEMKGGYTLSYSELFRVPESKWEHGRGWGLFIQNVQYGTGTYGSLIGTLFGFDSYVEHIYNLSSEGKGFYLKAKLSLGLEYEAPSKKYDDLRDFFGIMARLDESIGYNFGGNVLLSAGIYQQGVLFSRLLPYDLGFGISLTWTGNYISTKKQGK